VSDASWEPSAHGRILTCAFDALLTSHLAGYFGKLLVGYSGSLETVTCLFRIANTVDAQDRQTLLGGEIVDALFDLTDRVAVVSGASGGLGIVICEGLALYGADVALIDIDSDSLATSASGVERAGRRALALKCDASDERAVEDAFSRVEATFARVDILVNLAYTPTFGKPEELSLSDWEKALRINLTSYFLCCRQAGRRMIAQGRGGVIMNMCSIGGTSAMGRATTRTASPKVAS
jgi:hypothetical protein